MKMDAWWITIGGGRDASREYVRFLGFPVIAQVGANAIHETLLEFKCHSI